jgi:phosphate transport system permease protein
MSLATILTTLFVVSLISYFFGKQRVVRLIKLSKEAPASIISYYGYVTAIWGGCLFIVVSLSINYIYNKFKFIYFSSSLVSIVISIVSIFAFLILFIKPSFNARLYIERLITLLLYMAASICIFLTFIIVASIFVESLKFFKQVPILTFITGLNWTPQNEYNHLHDVNIHSFGAIPVFTGTLLITLIAIIIALPVGLFSAFYLTEYATRKTRKILKPILEILAGIPTVVYGYFAALTVGPGIRDFGEAFGLDITSESALSAGIVMGIMIIPFILSLSDDIINAVPQNLRDASLALGATKSETSLRVVLPAAMPGIIASTLLAISRAIGETMIVVMAAGLSAHLTFNPLQSVTTVTAQIVALLVGDQEFDSPKTLSAFALGLTLFLITFMLNAIALIVVKRYKERYE